MNSEEIILNAYKEGKLTLEESCQLLKDIRGIYQFPIYPQYPVITYKDNEFPKFEVTCYER